MVCVMTNSYFSQDADEYGMEHDITLVAGDVLQRWATHGDRFPDVLTWYLGRI